MSTPTPSPLGRAEVHAAYGALEAVGPTPYHPGVRSDSRRAASPLVADLREKLAKAEAKAAQAFDKLARLTMAPMRDADAIAKAAHECRRAQIAEANLATELDDYLDAHKAEVIAEAQARRDEARVIARAQADQLAACLDAVAEADALVKAVADNNKARGNGKLTAEAVRKYRPGKDALTRVIAYLDPPRAVIRVTPDAYRLLQRGEAVTDIDGNAVADLTPAVQVVYGKPMPRPGV